MSAGGKILMLLSAAYVYAFITWFIPIAATPFGQWNWQSLSIWGVLAPLLFLIGGGILLVLSLIVFLIVLAED